MDGFGFELVDGVAEDEVDFLHVFEGFEDDLVNHRGDVGFLEIRRRVFRVYCFDSRDVID